MNPIQMVDLHGQYLKIKEDVDEAIQHVLDSSQFIRGPVTQAFESALSSYLGGVGSVGVANGTDALQIALMALGIGPGDEVIAPSFTFVATAEAVGLLGATVVFADINSDTFNIDASDVERLITPKTKAIVPVHLFGQCADMDAILELGRKQAIPIIEDAAQAIGARWGDQHAGTMGELATLSFFPSKNLGCYGDGGAVLSRKTALLERVRLISNHGSKKKYHNEIVGVNSRLDALQAAILNIKLEKLDEYCAARRNAASNYDTLLSGIPGIQTPIQDDRGQHVFHQYTLRVLGNDPDKRDALKEHLSEKSIPSFVYYPVPLHQLPIYTSQTVEYRGGDLPNTVVAANEVLSIPMHTELTLKQQAYIADAVRSFFE